MPALVVLSLDDRRYALHLAAVERVARVVDVTPLPDAPDIIAGVVNAQGKIVPVVDIRKRFLLPEREFNLSDQIIFARTSRRVVALIVDTVLGVIECPDEDITAGETILPGLDLVEGVAKLKDGMVLIHNLERFLSLEESQCLDKISLDSVG